MEWSRRIYGRTGSHRVYRLTKSTAVKFGIKARSYEAATMRYIRQHTSIPVPDIFDVWMQEDGSPVIVMEWVNGKTLDTAWPMLSLEDKQLIANQLKRYLDELRTLRQPDDMEGWIGSYDRQPVSDALLTCGACGPFASDQEFNRFLLSRFEFMKQTIEGRAELEDLVKEVQSCPRRRVVLTHSDIMPRNILLDDHNIIVAILDWEMAGWMPEQWEYVKAMWMGQYDEGWPEFVGMLLLPYTDDLQLHNKMCVMHGAPFQGESWTSLSRECLLTVLKRKVSIHKGTSYCVT
jgi:serine/threonine protein kinase